jgi:hypothetical protein
MEGKGDKAKVTCVGPNKVHHMLKTFDYVEQLLLPCLVSDPSNFWILSVVVLANPSSHHEIFSYIRTSGHPEPSDQQITSWSNATVRHVYAAFGGMIGTMASPPAADGGDYDDARTMQRAGYVAVFRACCAVLFLYQLMVALQTTAWSNLNISDMFRDFPVI